MSKRGDGFGCVVVEMEGVRKANSSSKGSRGDPKGFVIANEPLVVWGDRSGVVGW